MGRLQNSDQTWPNFNGRPVSQLSISASSWESKATAPLVTAGSPVFQGLPVFMGMKRQAE